MIVYASTPAWEEPRELLERCTVSTAGVVDNHHVYEGGIAGVTAGMGPWRTQGEMRDAGRRAADEWAREHGREDERLWLLQLDADEALVNGERLRELLEHWPHRAFPIGYAQEDGQLSLAPFKLFRLPARIVACSEYVRFGRDRTTYDLAGYNVPPELRELILARPFIYHTPSARTPLTRRYRRLSDVELEIETRPATAVHWPLPPLTLRRRRQPAMKTDPDGTPREAEAEDGEFYCPGCGTRYDTPGVCEGTLEAKHEPIDVEKVADAGDDDETPAIRTHADADTRAAELGLTWPNDRLTVAEKVAAIEEEESKQPA